ncbi:MAG: hypothetical protein IIC10_01965 [Proteobacteria bacterium]|nr:hypothetical protein [Pseudomonadota bacterium]
MFTNAAIIAVLAIVIFIFTTIAWFKRASRVAIPDNRLAFLLLWSLATLLGTASFFSAGAGWLSGVFGAAATLGGVMLLGFYALRKQGAGDTISVGDRIPVFSALDGEGEVFESASLNGSPVLLKFFRGHW